MVAGPVRWHGRRSARLLADGLQKGLGQPVIVESKAGASGSLAIQDLVAKGKDGYTLLVIQDGAISEAPLAYKVSHQPFKDLKPLAQISRTGLVLVANKDLPANNIKELVSYGKTLPNGLDFASYATPASRAIPRACCWASSHKSTCAMSATKARHRPWST